MRRLPHRSEGERVVDLLEGFGCSVTPLTRGVHDPSGFDVLLILGNLVWYPDMVKALQSGAIARPPVIAVWHWEPLPPSAQSKLPRPWLGIRDLAKWILRDVRINDIYSNAARLQSTWRRGLLDILFTSTPGRIEFLAERGIQAAHAPLGYHPEHGEDLGEARDLPVLFLGDLRSGRRKRLVRQLRKRGVEVVAQGDWSRPDYWGESRTALLNRTCIFLNIQRFAGEFSGLRMILGMANGCLVLSEPMYRHEPFVAGEHFVSAPVDEMPSVIQHYLENEQERLRIAKQGRDFVISRLRLDQSVKRIQAACNERLAGATRPS